MGGSEKASEIFNWPLWDKFGDLPSDVEAKAATGFLAEGYERFHEVDPC